VTPDQLEQDILEARNRASYQVAKAIGEITDCIYDAMREQGLSQAALARRLGKSRMWVSKLLSGDHNMTVKTAVTVLHELGHSFDLAVTPTVHHEGPANGATEVRREGGPHPPRIRKRVHRARASSRARR